jgi:hypothetical protein
MVAISFWHAVDEERGVLLIPEKGEREGVRYSCFINGREPDESGIVQQTKQTLSGWRGGIWKLERYLSMVRYADGIRSGKW